MSKTVLITGTSRGIGAAIAKLFSENDYNIVINYNHSKAQAENLKEELEHKNIKVICVKADIANEEEVKEMIDLVLSEFKAIDVLINNAAIAKDEELLEKSVKDFREVIDVNLVGTFIVSKYVAKEMLKRKQGCIINIASTNGIDTLNTYSADYDASKSGIISLTKSFAMSLAPYIRVNAIAPGWTATESVLEMSPDIIKQEESKILLGRFARPEEIAAVALFLASDNASYINGSVLRVDGGCK